MSEKNNAVEEEVKPVEENTAVAPADKNENKRDKGTKKPSNPIIKHDIMRYKKNKLAANLALLGIVFACAYFIVLYAQVKNNNFYYKWSIAFDVIYNLFFLLFVFLFSEQVKNYNRKMFVVQMIVGALQIARIFWLPLEGIMNTYASGAGDVTVISVPTFICMTVFLALSGAFVIASAVIGYIRSKEVESFTQQLENGEIDLDSELKEETAGGNANA